MGTSTDAIVAFGFNLGEEWPEALKVGGEECTDFEDWISEHLGLGDWQQDGYFARKREAVRAFPVDIITHCSYDCPNYFIAVRGTEQRAHRGYPKKLELSAIDECMITALRQFCGQNEIPWEQPAWHTFSLWG
jgi:hypothetical protein